VDEALQSTPVRSQLGMVIAYDYPLPLISFLYRLLIVAFALCS